MYLFTRSGRVGPGSVSDAMMFVASMTEKVHQETGLDVHSWSATMSPELGTVVWATLVDTLDELETAQDKLAVSDPFIALAETGAKYFVGPLQDGVAQVITGNLDRSAPVPRYVSVARATAVNGRLSVAMEAAAEIAELATEISGTETRFLADITGPFGGCRWNSGFEDIASLERAEASLMADERWLELLDRVGTCFQAGVTQSIYRRIM